MCLSIFFFFFFFSSRRRHTRCLSDWSSDVCSSDLTCRSSRSRRPIGTGSHPSSARTCSRATCCISAARQNTSRTRACILVKGSSDLVLAQPQADWDGLAPVERKDLQPGDLLYFGSSAKHITHTGMYLGEGKFIDATTYETPMIRIDDLEEARWSRILVAMRRPK